MTPKGTKNDTHILATSESQDVECNGNENKQTTDNAPDTRTNEPVETEENVNQGIRTDTKRQSRSDQRDEVSGSHQEVDYPPELTPRRSSSRHHLATRKAGSNYRCFRPDRTWFWSQQVQTNSGMVQGAEGPCRGCDHDSRRPARRIQRSTDQQRTDAGAVTGPIPS